eukprot:Nitzschia sp. Nitz4//scaffold51_size120721//17088//26419//NITZ4_003718-RA/size120721-snap-gene-0.34-mRNA-1//-1//CDS//3329553835//5321//frame0
MSSRGASNSSLTVDTAAAGGTANEDSNERAYPMPAYLNFCPGGLAYGAANNPDDYWVDLGQYSQTSLSSLSPSSTPVSGESPDVLIRQAKLADDRLRLFALFRKPDPATPHVLPSLSVLAKAAFGRLTGVPPASAKTWADAMVLSYLDGLDELQTLQSLPTQASILQWEPPLAQRSNDTTPNVLRRLLEQGSHTSQQGGPHRPRPCGYVFKRNDIAWNCRTCQTDSTCVICDPCFRNSDHTGHEVFFHRTTPGGCCDCGDAEAWKAAGCCDQHRPLHHAVAETTVDDPDEAPRMASQGRQQAMETIQNAPTALPPKFAAALGVVIGAAVQCLVQAVDGAGVGADPIQWKLRWMDEASRMDNRSVHNEDYSLNPDAVTTPVSYWGTGETTKAFPKNCTLQLRLHNDDVHTFDEVISALHESASRNHAARFDGAPPLVPEREIANSMTHRVDADGQVLVKDCYTIDEAMQGFQRLKARGLHCAVVSTAQIDTEQRARALSTWLTEVSAAHPAAAVLVVEALVQVRATNTPLAGVSVWQDPRIIPAWASTGPMNDFEACQKRFDAFPPHLLSSYLTSEEAEKLHETALALNAKAFVEQTGADPTFYAGVPYRLPAERYRKSPHALWGTLPSLYTDPTPITEKHPFLHRLVTGEVPDPTSSNKLTEAVYVIDTDLRKQQEAERITSSVYPHRLPGLHLVSGLGTVRPKDLSQARPPRPDPVQFRHLLAMSSFRAPMSPIILLLLLDPYPTKQLRGAIHSLFLSLLTDARFKCRFAAALGIAYRPLSTLFCAGVGTETDTPLGFTVQIFTAGSLVRALGNAPSAEKLLLPDDEVDDGIQASIGVFTMPIALTVVRCIHTNLLGATKEVNMILKNTISGVDDDSEAKTNDGMLPALTYVAGEHPLLTALPAAPDDGFLDSRSTRHRRLPHLLRDLEYVIETPGTAMRLLLSDRYPSYQGASLSARGEGILTFSTVWARLLRLAQGMDPQKRKISGGHVEYEQHRWFEAFGLSLNFAATRDALAESPTNSSSAMLAPVSEDGSHLLTIREAIGNVMTALLREIKFWLYREGMLSTGLLTPPGGSPDLPQDEALQRSTLHVSASQLPMSDSPVLPLSTVALACDPSVKMTEAQLDLIESTLRMEGNQRQIQQGLLPGSEHKGVSGSGAIQGIWLKVPHSPLNGDSLSFHLPLHRALAKSVRSLCSVVVPESVRTANPQWWKLPVLDDDISGAPSESGTSELNPLVPLIRPVLRSSNCQVIWSAGPECSPQEAQVRRGRSRAASANIAVSKIIHSLADHPIRCLAAAQQIERHLWARNGASIAGMALNYSNAPLSRSFRDVDLTLVQLSASGMSVGLGASRVFALLMSRFDMDGYLCDPERRSSVGSTGSSSYVSSLGTWVNPPRLSDPAHAVVLSESFFSTLCVLVSELPSPPPIASSDETWLRQSVRRELIHALAAEPRSHSAAMSAASCAVGQRDVSDGTAGTSGGGGLFRDVFTSVLKEVGKQKNQGSRATAGPASFELDASCCDEYDPSFFHLRRQEHQHAMDIVGSLRKQKVKTMEGAAPDSYCFPLVCPPPKAHPRFLPCRLMLHLPPMDAAIRRALLFAVFAGSWLPPPEPNSEDSPMGHDTTEQAGSSDGVAFAPGSRPGDIPAIPSIRRGHWASPKSSISKRNEHEPQPPFSADVVATSAVSFLEVLQLLTLQVHTLEECASLHRRQPDLDEEARSTSASLSINTYLGRLCRVPESLVDVWALRPFPNGPLKSMGTGENRGSILGLLITLYEHRADHGAGKDSNGQDQEGHGGARTLTASGLKWLLRFVNCLVDGAPSVAAAIKSATTGVRLSKPSGGASSPSGDVGNTAWSIDAEVRQTILGMLTDLSDLWPKPLDESATKQNKADEKKRERGKAAQQRMLEMMRKKQSAFVASMGPSDEKTDAKADQAQEEADLCIICRCDDADGENNGPLGFLGHVQRSRASSMRSCSEAISKSQMGGETYDLFQRYRVVGHMGCQVRESEAMDSRPVHCLPRGSIVTVQKSTVSDKYDILSRRVLLRHVSEDDGKVTEGWASVQSSQGYVILSPLVSLCFESTRWGNTRPIVRQCGHAAHLMCVETHTLSLHQRAADEQNYDGRFAANIDDGEFLCPLCKQLSNILIPRDGCATKMEPSSIPRVPVDRPPSLDVEATVRRLLTQGRVTAKLRKDSVNDMGKKALAHFGDHLVQAMNVPWERKANRKRRGSRRRWHPAIQYWDYEEQVGDMDFGSPGTNGSVKNTLILLRQQLIAWAAIGHSAAAAEASVRGVEEVLPFGSFSKTEEPWSGYGKAQDSDATLLELTRTMTGASGLLEILDAEMASQLSDDNAQDSSVSFIAQCLADIVGGRGWTEKVLDSAAGKVNDEELKTLVLWSQLTALMGGMPSHVSRDGMLTQRHEARASAAAMWTVRGTGSHTVKAGEPPVPLAISNVLQCSPKPYSEINENWGTMHPIAETVDNSEVVYNPYRPAVATAFLYTPMLAWDLNTLAGAIFSSVLVNDVVELPTAEDLLHLGSVLVSARLIQCLVTPHGFDLMDSMEVDEEDEEGRWGDGEMQMQGEALAKLFSHCKGRVETLNLDSSWTLTENAKSLSPANLFGNVGRAVLPFARSLVLMMRACWCAIQNRHKMADATPQPSAHEKVLTSFLQDSEIMSSNDGFYILKEMQAPLPIAMIESNNSWWSLINRWLTSVIVLERHHGSRGSSVIPELTNKEAPRDSQLGTTAAKKPKPSTTEVGVSSSRAREADRQSAHASASNDNTRTVRPVDNWQDVAGQAHFPVQLLVDDNGDSEDDGADEMDVDEAEEMVGLSEATIGNLLDGFQSHGGQEAEESGDDPSTSGSEDGDGQNPSRLFAGVGQSPIVSYQPSLLAVQEVGSGNEKSTIDTKAASAVMADLSHLGAIHRKDTPTFSLIRLPKSFVELYGIVNKVKGRDEGSALDESDDSGNSEAAICLLTGAVMRSGSPRRPFQRSQRPPGACTLHARENGSGIGIFFLVQKCTVLLMHNNKSAYSASLYVDEHGEEDPGLRRGRPLFLNEARYKALESLWRQQGIPREVAQIRSTSERVIRDNWY